MRGGATGAAQFKPTTVFLTRHAERDTTPPEDPALTAAGKERAERLARMLEGAGVKAVFTSQFARTRETGRPLAETRAQGEGHVTRLLQPLDPTAMPALVEPSFPKNLAQTLAPAPPPARVAARAQAQPTMPPPTIATSTVALMPGCRRGTDRRPPAAAWIRP